MVPKISRKFGVHIGYIDRTCRQYRCILFAVCTGTYVAVMLRTVGGNVCLGVAGPAITAAIPEPWMARRDLALLHWTGALMIRKLFRETVCAYAIQYAMRTLASTLHNR